MERTHFSGGNVVVSTGHLRPSHKCQPDPSHLHTSRRVNTTFIFANVPTDIPDIHEEINVKSYHRVMSISGAVSEATSCFVLFYLLIFVLFCYISITFLFLNKNKQLFTKRQSCMTALERAISSSLTSGCGMPTVNALHQK